MLAEDQLYNLESLYLSPDNNVSRRLEARSSHSIRSFCLPARESNYRSYIRIAPSESRVIGTLILPNQLVFQALFDNTPIERQMKS